MDKGKEIRFGQSEREPLIDRIPLDVPLSLAVEPTSACNFKCKYCEQSLGLHDAKTGFTSKFLKMDLFCKMIDDIASSGKRIKALNLVRFGEPLLNKHLPEMIDYAKSSNVFDRIVTVSNGSLLNPELSLALVNAGLDRILISIQGITSEKYYELCGVKVDFQKLVDNIKYFYMNRGKCKLFLKVFYEGIDGNKDAFAKIFSDICDEYSFEHIVPFSSDIDYQNMNLSEMKDRYGDDVKRVDVCAVPFYILSVLSNGDVSACCNSNDSSFTLGNISKDSVLELWNSEKLKSIQTLHLSRQRYSHNICGNCNFPIYGMPESDNLDAIASSF